MFPTFSVKSTRLFLILINFSSDSTAVLFALIQTVIINFNQRLFYFVQGMPLLRRQTGRSYFHEPAIRKAEPNFYRRRSAVIKTTDLLAANLLANKLRLFMGSVADAVVIQTK